MAGWLLFHFDAIDEDLRAVVVGHIADKCPIEVDDLAGITKCLDVGLYFQVP
jgi:hypothetical protein